MSSNYVLPAGLMPIQTVASFPSANALGIESFVLPSAQETSDNVQGSLFGSPEDSWEHATQELAAKVTVDHLTAARTAAAKQGGVAQLFAELPDSAAGTSPTSAQTPKLSFSGVQAEEFGLTSEEVAEFEKRMRPCWQFSDSGFLGATESLLDVLARDRETLRRYDITTEEIANLLDQTISGRLECYRVELGTEVYEVSAIEYLGSLSCPFERKINDSFVHKGPMDYKLDIKHRGKHEYIITNIKTRKSILLPGLLVHLIRAHEFFEGEETPYPLFYVLGDIIAKVREFFDRGRLCYRIAPETIIKFFGMDKGNRSARVIESPQYQYQAYSAPVTDAIFELKSFYKPNEICNMTGAQGLEKFNQAVDDLHFINPQVREDWKNRAAEIVTDLGKKLDVPCVDWSTKLEALDVLDIEIDLGIIEASGFMPLMYKSDKTRSRITPEMERLMVAKAYKKIFELTDIEARQRQRGIASVEWGGRRFYRLVDWLKNERPNKFLSILTDKQFGFIEEELTQIDEVMGRHPSYKEGKNEMDLLLAALKTKIEAEYAAAEKALPRHFE